MRGFDGRGWVKVAVEKLGKCVEERRFATKSVRMVKALQYFKADPCMLVFKAIPAQSNVQ